MFPKFRRREEPWEVVASRSIETVPTLYEDEDIELESVSATDMRGTYVFEVKQMKSKTQLKEAVVFARQEFLQGVAKKGYNALMQESWSLTVYRRAKLYRVEVQYSGRPASVLGTVPGPRPPPFMAEILRDCLTY